MPYKNKEKQLENQRRWYARNKKSEYQRLKRIRQEKRQYVFDYKKNKQCEICGETHPACLEFHHKKEKEKHFMLSEVDRLNPSYQRIDDEIKKCKILCSNCHKKLHYNQ